MTQKEKNTYLHTLEQKLNKFRKRAPIYCQCIVLYDEDTVCLTIPDVSESTIRIPVDFSHDVSDVIKTIHDILKEHYPLLVRRGKSFYLDKIDFRTNTVVVKAKDLSSDWTAIYKMKRPISLLLKEYFQSPSVSPEEKSRIFEQNIREQISEEDYRVL